MSRLDAEVERVTRQGMEWPVELVIRDTEPGHERGAGISQAHLACRQCGQSAFCLSPDISQGAYVVTGSAVVAGIAAHMRQSHDRSVLPC